MRLVLIVVTFAERLPHRLRTDRKILIVPQESDSGELISSLN